MRDLTPNIWPGFHLLGSVTTHRPCLRVMLVWPCHVSLRPCPHHPKSWHHLPKFDHPPLAPSTWFLNASIWSLCHHNLTQSGCNHPPLASSSQFSVMSIQSLCHDDVTQLVCDVNGLQSSSPYAIMTSLTWSILVGHYLIHPFLNLWRHNCIIARVTS